VQQIQEDLPQEKADNEQEPDRKKAALNPSLTAPTAKSALFSGTDHLGY
jgi:hypothetical protein